MRIKSPHIGVSSDPRSPRSLHGRFRAPPKPGASNRILTSPRPRPDTSRRAAPLIRARPDLRVACLPTALERGGGQPYLALQERLWGSDNFFYGDYESMKAVCHELAPRYDEYTARLGQASSEPMMQAHLEACGLLDGEKGRVVRFARCCSVDRT